MMRQVRRWVAVVACATGGCGMLGAPCIGAEVRAPNVVLILADDLGMEALGCYGGRRFLADRNRVLGEVKTPHLDALAAGGMRFSSCFATPVCSPSRAELLTGKYNFRIGFQDILGRKGAARELDAASHPTLAQRLKEAGYVTAAVGKWHIGPAGGEKAVPTSADRDTDAAHVRACGFDRQCMFGGAHLREYGEPVEGQYTPDILQEWAFRFLASRRGQPEPFFLYYASPLPHFPYWPTPLNPDGPRGSADKIGQLHGDMANFPYLVQYLDQQVGALLAKLEELGLRENTFILFAGDNGTPNWMITEMADGGRISWGKGKMTDTGAWVPFLASWPGVIAPGSVYGGLTDFSDLLPTVLELAGRPVPQGLDGVSFARQLKGGPGPHRDWVHALYVDQYYVRDAAWKLRENGDLYDVRGSPYQETLVAGALETDEARAARSRLQAVLDRLHPR